MYAFILRPAVIVCSVVIEFVCFNSYPVLWCVKTRVCSMVSDPLSQLTAVFVPSGNDPHIVSACACEHLIPHTIVVLSC